ncbi:MAG: hypothetical protein ABL974_05150 [Prosthecobacter sp.]
MKTSALRLARFWTALCVLLIGSGLALWIVNGDLNVWLGSWRHTFHVTSLLSMRTTLSLLVIGMLFSWSSARLLATLLKACGPILMKTGFGLGKATVFFPVSALAWAFIGLWIGQLGHPIWTLMPEADVSAHLPMLELAARFVWTWVPALGLLSLSLTGQWLSLMLRETPTSDQPPDKPENAERSLATPHLAPAERDAGRQPTPSLIKWRAGILLSKPSREKNASTSAQITSSSYQGLWNTGLLALMLLICIEDALGIHGTAAALAQSLRAHDFSSAATALLMLTCIAILWTIAVSGPGPWPVKTFRSGLAALFKTAAWCVLVLSLVTNVMGLHVSKMFTLIDSDTAFASPESALWAGLQPMLCALSLWFVGHIISTLNES